MKTYLAFAGSFSLAALLLSAQAQTPATPHDNPSPAKPTPKSPDQRAAEYKGPKVVKDTKALGNKMIRDSKPDTQPLPSKPRPK